MVGCVWLLFVVQVLCLENISLSEFYRRATFNCSSLWVVFFHSLCFLMIYIFGWQNFSSGFSLARRRLTSVYSNKNRNTIDKFTENYVTSFCNGCKLLLIQCVLLRFFHFIFLFVFIFYFILELVLFFVDVFVLHFNTIKTQWNNQNEYNNNNNKRHKV